MKNISRPWQATTLALLGSIKIVLNVALSVVLLFFPIAFGTWMSQYNPEFIVFAALKSTIFIPIGISTILGLFLVRGVWRGQKWAPIVLTILHGLSLILMGLWTLSDARWAIPLAIMLFLLALEIECWVHPFFQSLKK